ncbi:MAG: glycosyltransferase [Bacteroidia bacterium]
MLLAEFIFWLSGAALFHTYIFYPLLLKTLAAGKKGNPMAYEPTENLPGVSIIIAAYNEETVIGEKIESVFNTSYPKEKIEVLIGSDCSTDKTSDIIKSYCSRFSQVELTELKTRSGKTGVVNALAEKAKHGILLFTDANVIFEPSTIFELIKHFKNDKTGLVDSNMINKGMRREGISIQEKTYIETEVGIKNAESRLWGCMMGPFGGCYALRKSYFSKIPSNYLVDDFYLNMRVLEKGGKCINEINARVYEDVSHKLGEEFRRKVRIATGNFQNLFAYAHLLLKFNIISFCFFSHKVLRWLGPVFMIAAFVSNIFLLRQPFYICAFILQIVFYLTPLIDFLLKKKEIHVTIIRFITHLLAMNLALFAGLIKFLKGVKSGVWEPTQRHQ